MSGFIQLIGEAIGRQAAKHAVDKMVSSGRMDEIIKRAVADNFERMATEPRFAHIASRLQNAANQIREELTAPLYREGG